MRKAEERPTDTPTANPYDHLGRNDLLGYIAALMLSAPIVCHIFGVFIRPHVTASQVVEWATIFRPASITISEIAVLNIRRGNTAGAIGYLFPFVFSLVPAVLIAILGIVRLITVDAKFVEHIRRSYGVFTFIILIGFLLLYSGVNTPELDQADPGKIRGIQLMALSPLAWPAMTVSFHYLLLNIRRDIALIRRRYRPDV